MTVNNLIEKYKLYNIFKIIIILLILFIIYRLFTNNIVNNINRHTLPVPVIEEFTALTPLYYGNTITLKNADNIPTYILNQCIFELDKKYRIDTIVLYFNINDNSISGGVNQFNNINNNNIKIQFTDDNDNLRYLKSTDMVDINLFSEVSGSGSLSDNYKLVLNNVADENDIAIYTSKIIVSIDNSINDISKYKDISNIKYISEYAIFGGDRNLFSKIDYNIISPSFNTYNVNTPSNEVTTDSLKITHFENINNDDDLKIYSMKINFDTQGTYYTNTEPCDLTIKYQNTHYTNHDFEITNKYKIRNDKYKLKNTNYIFIFLETPIISNKLMFEIQNKSYSIKIKSLTINATIPNDEDIKDFRRYVNIKLNKNNINEINVCPTIDNLLEQQNKTQQICDNLEYQDKIKSEKIRLERNKQYLLKLKNQHEQIDELNNVIQDLEDKREHRSNTADKIRVLQYQKQKGDASTIRDLANQRLESQDKNKLFMDVNLNYVD